MAKQATIKIDWQNEPGHEIPLNSRLEKDTFDLYPFAVVDCAEFYAREE